MTATEASVTGLHVGTSGFSYESWRGGFYPPDARPADFLRLFAERLTTVELNNTFYRLPSEEQFRRWGASTPDGFRFAVKMPRSITIFGRLDQTTTFFERIRALGDRLGPVLARLADERPRDDGFLELLLGSVDPGVRLALDLRHASWDGVGERLARAGAVRVNDVHADTSFRYLRFRDPPYDDAALAGWAARIEPLLASGVEVYAYFKHEDEPTGPRYATRLLELVAGARVR